MKLTQLNFLHELQDFPSRMIIGKKTPGSKPGVGII